MRGSWSNFPLSAYLYQFDPQKDEQTVQKIAGRCSDSSLPNLPFTADLLSDLQADLASCTTHGGHVVRAWGDAVRTDRLPAGQARQTHMKEACEFVRTDWSCISLR